MACDHHQAGDGRAFLGAGRRRREPKERETRAFDCRPHMGGAVGIAQRLLQHDAVARVRLDREREQPAGRQHLRGRCHHRREVADIDEHVGRQDQMVARAGFRLCRQELRQVERHQPIIKSLGARLGDHRRRQVDADQPVHIGPERRPAQAGAAAEIEHRADPRPLSGHRRYRLQQHRGPTIVEPLQQRRIEGLGMLIEQAAHIDRGHRRRDLAGAEPRELQPRAVIVLGVGVARLLPRRDRPCPVAEIVANGAEREPGGGEVGRKLDRLRQDIGGAGEIALRGVIERPLVAAVGDQIAG